MLTRVLRTSASRAPGRLTSIPVWQVPQRRGLATGKKPKYIRIREERDARKEAEENQLAEYKEQGRDVSPHQWPQHPLSPPQTQGTFGQMMGQYFIMGIAVSFGAVVILLLLRAVGLEDTKSGALPAESPMWSVVDGDHNNTSPKDEQFPCLE